VLLDLGGRQAVEGLWLLPWRGGLLRLPVAVSLVGQHTQRGEAAVGQRLAAELAGLLVAQQQPHRPGGQRTAAGTGQQTAEAAATALAGRRGVAGLLLQQILAGLEQLIEQTTGVHCEPPGAKFQTVDAET